ncbi:unnamed protein product [Litomosoides sigmodontis]|uniref:UBC core domain-containing protein n=1 Tax=Litomosoides sigmodontis TaxID=42156 RepID=A0A3P6SWQ0_LITSI|nr:unnamed protein product [Litomosoides sigmodontis]
MRRRNNFFSSSGSGFGSTEGVEIATEMAPAEPLRLPQELITEHIIMSEYAMICRDPIDGLYAVPSARNKFEWFGLLFIRRGVYAGAILRFTLHLPVDFPSTELPKVVFDLDVFHPHINPATRELDLKKYFADGWKSDQYHLYHILLIVQRTFFTFDSNLATCANIEAATLLRDNRELYRVRASELIRKSRSIVYDPVDMDDANVIRLMPWDASIHEPLRQRLIGGLTDSQISTMSLLGSLGCGLNRSSVFESRAKHGFSWISPTDLFYMVEPPRPAELDLKMISEAENCPSAEPSCASCPGGMNENSAINEIIIPHISILDLSAENDFKQEGAEQLQKEREKNDSGLLKDALQNEQVAKNDENSGPVEKTCEECGGREQEIDVKLFSGLEESTYRINEHVLDTNSVRAQSSWSSDEVGESDI